MEQELNKQFKTKLMAIFILGYETSASVVLTQYETKEQAEFESEEWCEVDADTLQQAIAKYDETFVKWQESENLKYNT